LIPLTERSRSHRKIDATNYSMCQHPEAERSRSRVQKFSPDNTEPLINTGRPARVIQTCEGWKETLKFSEFCRPFWITSYGSDSCITAGVTSFKGPHLF